MPVAERTAARWSQLRLRRTAHLRDLCAETSALDVIAEDINAWIHVRTDAPIRRPDQIPGAQAPWFARFFHAAAARGVYLPPSPYEVGFVSLADDPATLDTAAWALVAAANEADAA